jgi:hypothetical protein
MVFDGEKRVSSIETIFSAVETGAEVPEAMVHAIKALVSTIKTVDFIVETSVCGAKAASFSISSNDS